MRIGHNEGFITEALLGYRVDELYRGHHYTGKACLLLFELAKKHYLKYVFITCRPDNYASRKTCEYAGGKLLEISQLPKEHDLRKGGDPEEGISRFDL